MIARVLLLACAAALVAFGLQRHAAHDACQSARVDALSITLGRSPAAGAGAVAQRLQDNCRDAGDLANGAVAFTRVGALRPAEQLAGTAVRREPQRRNAWLALSQVLEREGDASGAARALTRARTLDPVGLAPGG
jgi:cytochrome c-type biogenesis protein CcmH/NrfG